MISTVACYHSVKLCALAARAFRSQNYVRHLYYSEHLKLGNTKPSTKPLSGRGLDVAAEIETALTIYQSFTQAEWRFLKNDIVLDVSFGMYLLGNFYFIFFTQYSAKNIKPAFTFIKTEISLKMY